MTQDTDKPTITKPVSTRISVEEFAKVLDCLLAKGIPANQIMSNSNIIKTAMRVVIATSPEPTKPATKSSIKTIKQLWKITKRAKVAKIEELG